MALTKIDDRGLTTPIDLLDSEKIRFGTGNDLEIYHDGTRNIIDAATSKNIDFYYNGAQQFWFGNAEFKGIDNKKIILGTHDDLQIYHDGSHNYITNAAGKVLYFYGDDFSFKNAAADETLLSFSNGYGVNLYYDNVKKLETTSTGAKVTGALQTTGNVDVNGGSINLGVIDTSSGHINAAEVMTFNIDTDNDDTTRYFGFYNNGAGGSGTELFRIQENGNASIGGIAPVPTDAAYNKALLHIHQTQSGTYGSELHLTNNTTGSAATDGMFLSMWTDNDVYFTNQEAGDINFTTNGHQAFQIQSNKNVKITDGNLIIDTAGHGIDFSATSGTGTSELLDDYEEGTWAPTVSSGGTAFGVTGTRYVKIGAQVTLWFDITNGSGSGTNNIYGLPFTPTNVHGNWNIGYYEINNASTAEDPTRHGGFVDYGTPRLSTRVPGGSDGWSIVDGARLIGCAVYWTTD